MFYVKIAIFAVLVNYLRSYSSGQSTEQPQLQCILKKPCELKDETSLRFFLLGDWGGLPFWPYNTPAQLKVAQAMAVVGSNQKTHFQLTLGDNMYTLGVKSAFDNRFKETFESVYNVGDALHKPWYIIAGNHDYYGNIDAEIQYTFLSTRWAYPTFYYTIQYILGNGVKIDFIMIDTVILCGNTKEGKFKNFFDYLKAVVEDRKTGKPENEEEAEKHWSWIEEQLAESTAHYVFVAGHYPVYSSGEHGPTEILQDRLRPLLHKYNASAYFSGHDHAMEHTVETMNGWTVHHVLSGAAALEMGSTENAHKIPPNYSQFLYPKKKGIKKLAAAVGIAKGAFVYAELGAHEAEFKYILGDQSVKYKFSLSPRHPVQSYTSTSKTRKRTYSSSTSTDTGMTDKTRKRTYSQIMQQEEKRSKAKPGFLKRLKQSFKH